MQGRGEFSCGNVSFTIHYGVEYIRLDIGSEMTWDERHGALIKALRYFR